jgi:tRNA/tmRNA/rRNA uracil-C5-methylase (TrmA/RlmC/RlmD family)
MLTENEQREMIQRLVQEKQELTARIEDLERSANSAREIARYVMEETRTNAIRFEFTRTAYGLMLIICAPQDEMRISKEAFAMLNPAIASVLGIDINGEPQPIGATG